MSRGAQRAHRDPGLEEKVLEQKRVDGTCLDPTPQSLGPGLKESHLCPQLLMWQLGEGLLVAQTWSHTPGAYGQEGSWAQRRHLPVVASPGSRESCSQELSWHMSGGCVSPGKRLLSDASSLSWEGLPHAKRGPWGRRGCRRDTCHCQAWANALQRRVITSCHGEGCEGQTADRSAGTWWSPHQVSSWEKPG